MSSYGKSTARRIVLICIYTSMISAPLVPSPVSAKPLAELPTIGGFASIFKGFDHRNDGGPPPIPATGIQVYSQEGVPLGNAFGSFGVGDGLAVGDVNGDGVDEIVKGFDHRNDGGPPPIPATGIQVYSQEGVPLGNAFGSFGVGDRLAARTIEDQDGDGLLDDWERFGVDVDRNGTIDLDLPAFGANPRHKDLFLELDYMPGNAPTQADIRAIKEAFAAAPPNAGGIDNPDLLPGITLWVDTGDLADNTASEDGGEPSSCGDGVDNSGDGFADGADPDCLVGDNFGGGNAVTSLPFCNLDDGTFYNIKRTEFNLDRRWVFRYGISAVGSLGCESGGQAEIGGNDFVNHIRIEADMPLARSGTIMHELGHTLNLHHGGSVDNNCKPNYVSVMNYDHQFGIPQTGGITILDFSPPRFAGGRGVAPLPTLKEDNLDEAIILDATDPDNQFAFVDGVGRKVRTPLNQPVDWNGDNVPGNTSNLPPINIDTSGLDGLPRRCTNNASASTLGGFDDWSNISLPFQHFGDSLNGPVNPVVEPEPTVEELAKAWEALNTTDVAISMSASPDPVMVGGQLVYTVTVINRGPNPASQVQVVDALPPSVMYQSSTTDCVQAATSTLTCELGELLARETRQITISALVEWNGSATIANTVSVLNQAGPDPDMSNNSVSVIVSSVSRIWLPIVTTPPPAPDLVGSFSLSPNKLNYTAGEQVQITVTVTNTGTAASGPFWIDFFINPSSPPTATNTIWSNVCGMTPCFGITWVVNDSLAPRESITLTSTPESFSVGHTVWPGWFASGTSDLYLYVDSYNLASPSGAVAESDESNNRAELHGLTVTGNNPALTNLSQNIDILPRPLLHSR